MTFDIADSVKVDKLKLMFNQAVTLHLSSNDPGITGKTVVTDFVEVVDRDYAPVSLNPDKWTYIVGDDIATAYYPLILFKSITGYLAVCYYLVAGGKLLLAESPWGNGLAVSNTLPLVLNLIFLDQAVGV